MSLYRSIQTADLAAIVSIEEQVQVSPWTYKIFQDCLHAGYYCVASQQAGEIEAYAIMSMAAQEAHILNIAVSLAKQQQGLGRTLLQHLLDIAHQQQTHSIFLEVRESNQIAQNLYEQQGFNALAVRQNYYPCPQGREDAIIMAREL